MAAWLGFLLVAVTVPKVVITNVPVRGLFVRSRFSFKFVRGVIARFAAWVV